MSETQPIESVEPEPTGNPHETGTAADHDPANPPDPSNSPIEDLVEPLDTEDDIYQMVQADHGNDPQVDLIEDPPAAL